MTSRLEFVVAGDSRETIERRWGVAAWRILADNGFVERTSVSCVGFRRDIQANSLLVVLPKAFSSAEARVRLAEPTYAREQIYRLIRIFRKIRRETSFALDAGTSNKMLEREVGSTDPVLDSFDAALRLRRDYLDNGLYIRKSTRPTMNTPNLPVDWPRTISRATALLTEHAIFFDNTVHHARKRDMSHRLCLLHISCLKEIFTLIGERNDLERVEALDPNVLARVKAKPRSFLRDLRVATFDERGRFLIAAISAFLSESRLNAASSDVREEILSYTKDFEDIWEKVLRDLFAPHLKDRTLPAGQWHSWPEGSFTNGIRPEFDIKLATDNAEVLIDAKDYRVFNGSKWLGSSGDHYKQIIYRQLLVVSNGSTVVNILAFPKLGQESLFSIRGCHSWKEIPGSYVFEVTVDYDVAVKRWLRETALDVKEELTNLLSQLQDFGESVTNSTK